MSNVRYAKLTKNELLLLVENLESELAEARAHTLDGKWDDLVKEAKLLAEDVQKVIAFVYNAGVNTRQQLQTVRIFKD